MKGTTDVIWPLWKDNLLVPHAGVKYWRRFLHTWQEKGNFHAERRRLRFVDTGLIYDKELTKRRGLYEWQIHTASWSFTVVHGADLQKSPPSPRSTKSRPSTPCIYFNAFSAIIVPICRSTQFYQPLYRARISLATPPHIDNSCILFYPYLKNRKTAPTTPLTPPKPPDPQH